MVIKPLDKKKKKKKKKKTKNKNNQTNKPANTSVIIKSLDVFNKLQIHP